MKQKPTHKTASLGKKKTPKLLEILRKSLYFLNYIFIQLLKSCVFFYKTASLKSKIKLNTELVPLLP